MTSHDSPLGGAYVSGITLRDELGTYTSTATTAAAIGTFTGVPVTGRPGRFVDTEHRRGSTATASNRTVTGSFRTATGSFRTA